MCQKYTCSAEARWSSETTESEQEIHDDFGKHPPEVANVDVRIPLSKRVAEEAVLPAHDLYRNSDQEVGGPCQSSAAGCP